MDNFLLVDYEHNVQKGRYLIQYLFLILDAHLKWNLSH